MPKYDGDGDDGSFERFKRKPKNPKKGKNNRSNQKQSFRDQYLSDPNFSGDYYFDERKNWRNER